MYRFKIVFMILSFMSAILVLSAEQQPKVQVNQSKNVIEIDNGLVKARFTSGDGGVMQEFFALKNGLWKLVVESFLPPVPFPKDGNALYNSLVGDYRFVVPEDLRKINLVEKNDESAQIKLSGSMGSNSIEQMVKLSRGDHFFHFEIGAELSETPAKLEYLISSFVFNLDKAPSFVHTPSLKDIDTDIIGDRCFHAPAIILQEDNLFCALVPDLKMINEYKVLSPDARRDKHLWPGNPRFNVPFEDDKMSMPTALDLNVISGLTSKPLFSYGLIDYLPAYHVRWRHPNDGSMVRILNDNKVRYGFDLFVGADTSTNRGYQQVSRHQWKRFGSSIFAKPRPQAMPFAEYAKIVYQAEFNPLGEFHPPLPGYKDTGSFLEFELDGQTVGGYRNAARFWNDCLVNGLWWNNVSDAVGFYFWGNKLSDPDLISKARRIINLAMLAPQQEGLFPVIYKANEKRWVGNHFDPPIDQPTKVFHQFQTGRGYNSYAGGYAKISPNRFLTKPGWDSKSYLVAACSRTGANLIEYYKHCEKDPRIIPFLKRYADYMLTQIDDNGTVPAWITYDLKPHWILRESAHNGATMWFLAELYGLTKEKKFLDGAEKLADFMIREILPQQDWRDLENYFSCGKKPIDYKDLFQTQPPRGVLSMIWGAEGFASLYRATANLKYLDAGEQVIDYFCLYQEIWDPHFIYEAYPFGGCDTDNGDGAWLNGHQTQTVEPLIWYGLQLGRQDLLERGVAAAHASITLINHPRHQTNDIWRHSRNVGFDKEMPVGIGPENIGHPGFPSSAMRTSPGLGEGSGVNTGLGEAYRELGGGYVNVAKNLAVGVDGVYINSAKLNDRTIIIEMNSLLARLEDPWDKPYTTDLHIVELPDNGVYKLVINDNEPVKLSAKDLVSVAIVVNPDGSIILK